VTFPALLDSDFARGSAVSSPAIARLVPAL
jgi:hypothetical protein